MNIRKSGYEAMDWVKALEAAQKPKDPSHDLGKQNEAELVNNALESTARVAFDLPVNAETKHEALLRSSKEIADKVVQEQKLAAANTIKQKVAVNGIDPVALGVKVKDDNGQERSISKEEWDSASDAVWVEKVATQAALEHEKQVKHAWEKNALKPAQHLSSTFDPTMREGRIMSSTGANEETRGRPTQIPANAASIFDPFRLDRFAKQETEHDKAVREKREADKARIEDKKAQLVPKEDPNMPGPMRHGQIMKSGGEDSAVFQQRVPKDQISMLDVAGTEKLSQAEMTERLSQLFTRVEDNGQKIREANKARKETIQGKKEPDRSWEKLEKPISTAQLTEKLVPEELTKRLSDLFTCPKKDGE